MAEQTRGLRQHDYYTGMVENAYFATVDRKDMDAVLECFRDDAVFTIQSAFTTPEGRDSGIRKMFENLFETYSTKIVHRDFRHVVDVENNRCAAQFEVELTDGEGNETRLSNCNFFYLDDDGKFERVFVYMSGENVLV